jgi:tetratricopeptide (TPR) repeat protein
MQSKLIFFFVLLIPFFGLSQKVDPSLISFDKGFEKYLSHDLDSAKVYFNYAVRSNVKNLKAHFYLAKIEFERLNYPEALAQFDKLSSKNWEVANYSESFWNMVRRTIAHAYYASHLQCNNEAHLKQALTTIKSALSKSKCEAENHYIHSMILTEMGKTKKAIKALKNAIYAKPTMDEAYVKLAALEDSKLESILYLSTASKYIQGPSFSMKRLKSETHNLKVDYRAYVNKKQPKLIKKIDKKHVKGIKRCAWSTTQSDSKEERKEETWEKSTSPTRGYPIQH